MKKKHSLTLMEIMIVICLIGVIVSVIGFNMKGSLEKGKKFKTEHAAEQIKDILHMEMIDGNYTNPVELARIWKSVIRNSPIPKKPDELLKDGWGNEFDVEYDAKNGDFIVSSPKYNVPQQS